MDFFNRRYIISIEIQIRSIFVGPNFTSPGATGITINKCNPIVHNDNFRAHSLNFNNPTPEKMKERANKIAISELINKVVRTVFLTSLDMLLKGI